MPPLHPPLYLAGQTGGGKTAVALELAERLAPVEIVNADAFQIYRGMEILSAAPTPEERSVCPHHLYGLLDPAEECDAATFAAMAKRTIAEVATRALPLVVGGSGLYLKAITHGLAPTPKGDPALRSELGELPLEELVRQYRGLDPEGAAQTNLKNRRYVTRNLEICLLLGRPASAIKNEWRDNRPDIRAVYLDREREDINARIDRRTLAMFEAGVVEEVGSLGDLSPTAAKAIGLREIRALIEGGIDRETCIASIQQATRRYAKRQATWFRREREFRRIAVPPDAAPDRVADDLLTDEGSP
ncbi:MAG: tRNA (adenosine(37)-N6)-dimethylallyltransferase MiaA [Verrucomicrobiales bacterium]